MLKGATISEDQRYRYSLRRVWNATRPSVLFIMLNPSTADARDDDPTIRRCIRYAKDWGFGGLLVGNLYAYRTAYPRELWDTKSDPVGDRNDAFLKMLHTEADTTVCAWGAAARVGRVNEVLALLLGPVHALAMTKRGQPAHPLYQPSSLTPFLWADGRKPHES